jgi:aryl carrier-like protein
MKEKGETLIGVFRYKTDLFEAATIAQLCQNFQIILEELVANPDRPLTELPSFRGNQQVPLTNLPQHQPRSTAMDYVAPVEKLDRQIAEIWQKVLQVESVGLHDNFFAIGGRSLAMIQVYSQLQNLGNLDLSLGELFKHPTVFEMAQYLRQKDVENCLTYEANPKNYR